MSANNQTLVQEYKGKWYVFTNVVAEEHGGWNEETEQFDASIPTNQIKLSENVGAFDSLEEAFICANNIEEQFDSFLGYAGTEYGVIINSLSKDGSKVNIIE